MAADAPPLLFSDRPLFVSGAFGAADCYLTLPIAKDRLIVAACSEEMERKFKSQPQSELIRSTNMQVAKEAAKYGYGSDNPNWSSSTNTFRRIGPSAFSKGCASIESKNMHHPRLDRQQRPRSDLNAPSGSRSKESRDRWRPCPP
jgi:hypothetical protein